LLLRKDSLRFVASAINFDVLLNIYRIQIENFQEKKVKIIREIILEKIWKKEKRK